MSAPKPIHVEAGMTVDAAVALAHQYEAGVIKLVHYDSKDDVAGAVIIVTKDCVRDVLDALEALEEKWEVTGASEHPHSSR